MRILIYSDLHAHPFKDGRVLESGLNSRLVDCIDVLRQIHEFAYAENIDVVLFGGDLFHTRKSLDTAAFNEVFTEISLQEQINPYVMVPGNHDQYDKLGEIHALEAFGKLRHVHVVNAPRWIDLGQNVFVYAIPYIHSVSDFLESISDGIATKPKNGFCIGLFHVGIDKTKIGQGRYAYRIESDIAIGDLHPEEWDVVFVGHYHTPQSLSDNVHYIGAPLQHGWADEGEDRGFIVFDTDTGVVERISADAPRFVTLEFGEEAEEDITEEDYLRIIFTSEPSDVEIAEVEDEWGEVTVAVKKEKAVLQRTEISLADSRRKMLRKYVKVASDGEFKISTLMKFGKRYIQ